MPDMCPGAPFRPGPVSRFLVCPGAPRRPNTFPRVAQGLGQPRNLLLLFDQAAADEGVAQHGVARRLQFLGV